MINGYVLHAINGKDPAWKGRPEPIMCEVYAESEAHARQLAAQEFQVMAMMRPG
jgi:hypothetical protein